MLNIEKMIDMMTLEEKASLCSGHGFWYTKEVKRLDLPAICMNDGPHGLRKPEDEMGSLGESHKSTCFPTYSALGSSWDTCLMHEVGSAIADEAKSFGTSILLGPGINIKRSPLCGRNFEYISEDPYLSGKMGASFIRGTQENGVGTSLKHFAVNNQETKRMHIDAIVDERALREIYLTGFEIAVKESDPWTIMGAYNKLGGTYCCENYKLLTQILRNEWGFNGIVVTDWGACNDRVDGIKAGQDLQMPENQNDDAKIVKAVEHGQLDIDILDKTVERILKIIDKALDNKEDSAKFNIQKNHDLARRACSEASVLLKNDGILPVKPDAKIAIIGELAERPHFQGGGSSNINPTKVETAHAIFTQNGAQYAKGYSIKNSNTTSTLLDVAAAAAKSADIAIVFAGYTDALETEGIDKETIAMPDFMNDTINTVTRANHNTIVVLHNGSAILMPWLNDVSAVLECYLPGQASGGAIYDIISGAINPSGKLTETFPLALSDTPSYKWFPGGPTTVEYRESIYVGYRYFDTAKKDVLFPFGYGLSYTTFKYENLKLSADKIPAGDNIKVTLDITNTGEYDGAEIVQLYVKDDKSTVDRPEKELKGFKKVWIKVGETKTVTFNLDKRSFAYYNTEISDWHIEQGSFTILIGASSNDIRLKNSVYLQSDESQMPQPVNDYNDISTKMLDISDDSYKALLGHDIPQNTTDIRRPFDTNSSILDLREVFFGRMLHSIFVFIAKRMNTAEFESNEALIRQMEELPLRGVGALSGLISPNQVDAIIMMANGRFFKGFVKAIRNK